MQLFKQAVLSLLVLATLQSCNQQPKVLHSDTDGFEMHKDGPGKYAEYHRDIRTSSGDLYPAYQIGDIHKELLKARANAPIKRSADLDFVERGPANGGGRVRGLLVDPTDSTQLTWFVASVGGGIWKTSDAGESWELKTPDIANMATSTIAMSASNPERIYVGTGEGFGNLDAIDGSGLWVSNDRGETWEVIEATAYNIEFSNIDRIVVDPENADNIILCSTYSGTGNRTSFIMKSTDGGASWERTFAAASGRIQQIIHSPTSFDTLYASINSAGVFRSTDMGENWSLVFDTDPFSARRIEMAISPSNPKLVYLSCESGGTFGSRLLMTRDGFETTEAVLFQPRQPDWLGGQGWYDNTIAVHPYDDSKVWVAGQSALIELSIGTEIDSIKTLSTVTLSASYLTEIDDSGILDEDAGLFIDIAGDLGYDPEINTFEDINRVRVTVGNGRNQMAHLLNLDFITGELTFNKMIEVPFEVVQNGNEQIAVSVVDVNGDGVWTLEDYTGLTDVFHDVILTNAIPYTIEGDSIIKNINPVYKGQYYFAYGLDPEFTGDINDLPTGRINFTVIDEKGTAGAFEPIADGYGRFNDIKAVGSKGVHVDHHNIVFIPRDSSTQSFYILNANDGGLAFSLDNGNTFKQTGDTFNDGSNPSSDGLNITQFYGIDKKNGEMQFVGGTQDNGSWTSSLDPEADSKWNTAPSGDGFEAAWNYGDVNQVLETSQFNGLWKSYDGGINWQRKSPPGRGPFVTRLASSHLDPDLVLMNSDISEGQVIGNNIIRSKDFGETWEIINMPGAFDYNNGGAPIKVSLVNPDIIWTGGIMRERDPNGADISERTVCVSTNNGESFSSTQVFNGAETGTISGIAVHPEDDSTAYVTFSQANTPKIIRTTDLGQTWEDLTGFKNNNEESDNGYPDVATYCVYVMPWDTEQIWAGTDIGIIESLDGGDSWAIADNGFPAVAIWDIRLVNDELVFATHGRGIWTLNVADLLVSNKELENAGINAISLYPNPSSDFINVDIELSTAGLVAFQLYDLEGKLIASLAKERLQAGNNTQKLNLPEVINGTYIMTINTETGTSSKKISIFQ